MAPNYSKYISKQNSIAAAGAAAIIYILLKNKNAAKSTKSQR